MPRRAGIPRKSKYETAPANRNTARFSAKLMKDGVPPNAPSIWYLVTSCSLNG